MSTLDERSGFGPFLTLPTFWSSSTLSTTPTKVTLPTPAPFPGNSTTPPTAGNVRITIVNGHATNTIAWSIVDLTNPAQPAPSITADYVNATCAAIILPGASSTFVIPASRELYVVASAASTTVNVTSFLYI